MKKAMIGLIAVILIQFVIIAVLFQRNNSANDGDCGHEVEMKMLRKECRYFYRQLRKEKAKDGNYRYCGHKEEMDLIKDRNRMLVRQLKRERSRVDDNRNGDSCPLCGNDSIIEILYGFGYLDIDSCKGKKRFVSGGCLVSSASKRFVCRKCEYQWGLMK